jgi:hypothetical protein
MIQVFVLLAVLLGISSVLAISVVQKSRQLGILKAMGIKDRAASWIFLRKPDSWCDWLRLVLVLVYFSLVVLNLRQKPGWYISGSVLF